MTQQSATLPQFVDLNILPEELRPRRNSPLFVLGIVALLVAGLALVPLFSAERTASDETARLQAELDLISVDLTRVQTDLANVRGVQRELQAAETDLANLNEERQAILGAGQELSSDLLATVSGLPPGASLRSVTGSEGQITLTGQALSSEDIFEYARTMEKDGRFAEARIVSLETASSGAAGSLVTFTIEAVR